MAEKKRPKSMVVEDRNVADELETIRLIEEALRPYCGRIRDRVLAYVKELLALTEEHTR